MLIHSHSIALPLTTFDVGLVHDGVFFAAGHGVNIANILFTSVLDVGTIEKVRVNLSIETNFFGILQFIT